MLKVLINTVHPGTCALHCLTAPPGCPGPARPGCAPHSIHHCMYSPRRPAPNSPHSRWGAQHAGYPARPQICGDKRANKLVRFSYDLHPKLNPGLHRVPTSPRRGPRLPKPSSPACSTANSGLTTGLRCSFGANLICLAGRAAGDHYFRAAMRQGSADDLS